MDELGRIFLEQGGLFGAICVVLAGVVLYLNNKLDKKDAENDALRKENSEIHEKWRLSETGRADRYEQLVGTATAVQSALVEKIKTGRGKA